MVRYIQKLPVLIVVLCPKRRNSLLYPFEYFLIQSWHSSALGHRSEDLPQLIKEKKDDEKYQLTIPSKRRSVCVLVINCIVIEIEKPDEI